MFEDLKLYRNQGIMTAIRTESNQSLQLMKSLEKLGILTYLYVNEEEEGLSIMPPININLNVLEKALKLISKKIESQNSF